MLTFDNDLALFSKIWPWSTRLNSLPSSTTSQSVDSVNNGFGSLSSNATSIFSRCFMVSIGFTNAAEAAENCRMLGILMKFSIITFIWNGSITNKFQAFQLFHTNFCISYAQIKSTALKNFNQKCEFRYILTIDSSYIPSSLSIIFFMASIGFCKAFTKSAMMKVILISLNK